MWRTNWPREMKDLFLTSSLSQVGPPENTFGDDMGVSKNRGTPKSSILIGFSIINHPFWGTSIFGNTHMFDRNQNVKFCFFL